jgi:hypothetical protein
MQLISYPEKNCSACYFQQRAIMKLVFYSSFRTSDSRHVLRPVCSARGTTAARMPGEGTAEAGLHFAA